MAFPVSLPDEVIEAIRDQLSNGASAAASVSTTDALSRIRETFPALEIHDRDLIDAIADLASLHGLAVDFASDSSA